MLQLDGGVAPLPGWALVEVTGRHRQRFLQSQLTSDVAALAEGESQLSALLDRSGRLQAFFFLRARRDAVDLLIPDDVAGHGVDRLSANIIADDVVVRRKRVGAMRLALGPAAVAMAAALDPADHLPVAGWGHRGFVTWTDLEIPLAAIDAAGLEELRVLGGPPAWGREVGLGQLVNETALLATAVSFTKGCYLGQETVAKLASHRGAVRAPVLLELDGVSPDIGEFVGQTFAVGERARAGEVLSGARRDGIDWLQVALHRELRVPGRELVCELGDGRVFRATVRAMPLLAPPSREAMAERLTVAASAAFTADDPERALVLLDRAVAICPTWADAVEASGVILGRLGRHAEAVERMHRLLEVDPSSVMAHSNLSLLLNQLGDIEAAEHHLALATRASFAGAQPARDGDEASREADLAEVERRRRADMFGRVLEIDPDDPIAHFGLGELLAEQGRYNDAVGHLERAIAGDPEHAAAMLALGGALEGLGESDRARAVYASGVAVAAKKGHLSTAQKMQERLNALETVPGSMSGS